MAAPKEKFKISMDGNALKITSTTTGIIKRLPMGHYKTIVNGNQIIVQEKSSKYEDLAANFSDLLKEDGSQYFASVTEADTWLRDNFLSSNYLTP